jgi:hypothetical protein
MGAVDTGLPASLHSLSRSLLTASAASERLDYVIAAAQCLSLRTGHCPDSRGYRTGAVAGRGLCASWCASAALVNCAAYPLLRLTLQPQA